MTENNWKLVDAFFDKYDLVDHHIKSYNDFINSGIQNIIDITEPITLENGKYTLKTGKLFIEKPFTKEADGSKSMIYPAEARLRNLNYSAHMYLEMALNEEGEDNPLEKVYIALIVKVSEKGTVSAELYYRPIRSKGGTVIDVILAKALAEKYYNQNKKKTK